MNFGQYYLELAELDFIVPRYRKEIADLESILGPEHLFVFRLQLDLYSVLEKQERWEEVADLYQAAVQKNSKRKICPGLDELVIKQHLVRSYSKLGKLEEAEEIQMQVVESMNSNQSFTSGPDHPHAMASVSVLASLYFEQKRFKNAEELQTQLLQRRKRVLGPRHPSTLVTMHNLATSLLRQERWKEVEELELQVLTPIEHNPKYQ
ncbi:MAG: hypothetical protein Q9187_003258, partial [Circinaria calcarea]